MSLFWVPDIVPKGILATHNNNPPSAVPDSGWSLEVRLRFSSENTGVSASLNSQGHKCGGAIDACVYNTKIDT